MFNIVELLALRGLSTKAKITLVRHQHPDIDAMYEDGSWELYQSYQTQPRFDKYNFVVSFIALDGTLARFVGVYEVKNQKPSRDVPLPDGYLYPDIRPPDGGYFYKLERVPGFEDFIDRVVIDWGKAAVVWQQKLTEKPIIQILPKCAEKPFPGYDDVILSHDELLNIVNNLDCATEWYTMLSSIAGVYLILDTKEGKQYVGAAYGRNGIWGRWAEYAKTSHGNNKKLEDLVKNSNDYPECFQYSILKTLPKSLTNDEALKYERLYKTKLGSRSFGLNT